MLDIESNKIKPGDIVVVAKQGNLEKGVVLGTTSESNLKVSYLLRFHYFPSNYDYIEVTPMDREKQIEKHNDVKYVSKFHMRGICIIGNMNVEYQIREMMKNRERDLSDLLQMDSSIDPENVKKKYKLKNLENVLK